MKIEVIPSLSHYESEIHPEDTSEHWGGFPKKVKVRSQDDSRTQEVFEELERETVEQFEPKLEPVKKEEKKEALVFAFPPLTMILAAVGLLILLFIVSRFMR